MRLVPRPRRYDFEAGGCKVPLSPIESVIVARLLGAKSAVTTKDLVDAVYGHDPDGGPLTADICVRVVVTKLRRKLRRTGVRIIGRSWHGYRLVEDAAGHQRGGGYWMETMTR